MEFKKYKIKDIGEVVTGFTPSKKEKDLYGFTFPFITPSDITNSKYVNPKRFLSEKAISKKEKKVCSKSSVGVSCIGSDLGKAFFIQKISFTNQQINTITNIKKNFDPEYIYYKIKTLRNYFHRIADGSTMPIINKSKFENLSLDIPSLKNQKKISNILSVLDNKIEINKKIIANLEELSQTLFKRWFVDFEFPDENGNPYKSSGGEMVESELGEIPKFWNVEKAEDIYKITIGKTPPRKLTELFSENEGIDWVSISDMKTEGMFINHTKEKIVEEGIINYKVKVVPKGSVLLSFKLTIGRVKITNKELTTNEAIAHFFSDNMHQLYTYLYLKNFNFEYLGNTSSIATAINSKIVKKMPILVPKQRILAKFINRVEPFMKSIDIVQCENIKLTQLRDTLLPKLMSGEIEIPDDIEVNEDELSI